MAYFDDLATRINGDDILASWFNAIKSAGQALQNSFGPSVGVSGAITLPNNQSSPVNISTMVPAALTRMVIWGVKITRNTNTSSGDAVQAGTITAYQYSPDGSSQAWAFETNFAFNSIDTGITLSIDTTTGQMKAASTDLGSGFATTRIRYNVVTSQVN